MGLPQVGKPVGLPEGCSYTAAREASREGWAPWTQAWGRRPWGTRQSVPAAGASWPCRCQALSAAPGGKERALLRPSAGLPHYTCSLAPSACTAQGFTAHHRVTSALLVAVSPDHHNGTRTALLTPSAAHLTTVQSCPRGHVPTPSSSGSRASTRGRQGADGEAAPAAVHHHGPLRARTGPLQSPACGRPRSGAPPGAVPTQARLTSVLTGDPAHSFPELR